jgi:Arc/MetJ-type ribon-helix-helix transcriptional regulator
MTAVSDAPAGAGEGSSAGRARAVAEMVNLLSAAESAGDVGGLGRARKVSVSMPESLAAAIQQRVGRGEFSHYVTEAVSRQLGLDLLSELATLLETEHGPVPEEFLAEAGAAWPDAR